MLALLHPPVPGSALALVDAVAIAVFAVIGIVSHTGGVSATALAEDVLPLLAGWFAAAAALGLYARHSTRALLATWAIGIPLGVAVRAAVLGRLDEPRQLAFLATTLVLTAAFVVLARSGLGALGRRRSARGTRAG